jgi:hypothetical protein
VVVDVVVVDVVVVVLLLWSCSLLPTTMQNPPPWKDSQAKALLRADILCGLVPPDMQPTQVFHCRPEFQVYPYSNFANNLKRLRESLARNATTPAGPTKWKNSNAKAVLRAEIISGLVGPGMQAREVYNMHPDLYHPYLFRNFAPNLTKLRVAIAADHERMITDSECHDVAIVQGVGFRSEPGYLPWHRSTAATLLAQDVADGLNNTMRPHELYLSRPEYQAFSMKKFRQFIYQAVVKASKKEACFLRKQQKNRM